MADPKNRLAFATRTIHGGQYPDSLTGAVMVPIYATSTYAQASPGVNKGYEYSRSANPTRSAFERAIADLESGQHGYAFASGLAAISTVLELFDAGAHVVASDDLYGGSFRLFDKVRRRSAGLSFSFVDFRDLDAVEVERCAVDDCSGAACSLDRRVEHGMHDDSVKMAVTPRAIVENFGTIRRNIAAIERLRSDAAKVATFPAKVRYFK